MAKTVESWGMIATLLFAGLSCETRASQAESPDAARGQLAVVPGQSNTEPEEGDGETDALVADPVWREMAKTRGTYPPTVLSDGKPEPPYSTSSYRPLGHLALELQAGEIRVHDDVEFTGIDNGRDLSAGKRAFRRARPQP